MENTGGSTKQLKQILGFGDLMGAAVGQIIGSGVMTLIGIAIALTGRSVPFAFIVTAVLVVCGLLSLIFISGTVRLRGGQYTMVSMLMGEKFAGAYTIIYVVSNLSISMYALSFASYFISLFGFGNEKIIAFLVLTLFFVLNCLGVDKFAKVQNLIVICLSIALALFAIFGLRNISPDYFASETFMPNGIGGFLRASSLLTFALGGANCIVNLSAEAKNPVRDVPLSMICATALVAVLYGIVAFVAAGVLPLEQVAGQNLSLVAKAVLPNALYVFFMVCGAGFALISTMNSQFAWAPKPVLQACDDGWLPAGLAKLSKWKTPYILMGILYGLGVICIFTGLSVAVLGNISLIATSVVGLMISANLWRLPKVCPEEWAKSRYRVSQNVLTTISGIAICASVLNIYLNATQLSTPLLVANVAVIAGAFVFSFLRSKHVHMEISYESVSDKS